MSVNIGVVGLGIGARHVESLERTSGATIVAVADLDLDRATGIANRCGARAYPDWQAMLAGSDNLDAVILATPAHLRLDPIRAICEKKLALLCEKPPALSSLEARGIRDVIAHAGMLNTAGFMYRWNPLATRLKELVDGRPLLFARSVVAWPILQSVAAGHLPQGLYRKDVCGGPLIEQAIHYQDVLRYITGDDPLSVQAMAEPGSLIPAKNRDCEETTIYMMRHRSGMLSTHVQNWSHKRVLIQLQLVGEDLDLTWRMEGGAQLEGTVDGVAIHESNDANNYYEEIVGFVNSVARHDQGLLRSSYADACRSLAVCEAAASAVVGGACVPVVYC